MANDILEIDKILRVIHTKVAASNMRMDMMVYIDEGHGNLLLSLSETLLLLCFKSFKMYMWCFKLCVAQISFIY